MRLLKWCVFYTRESNWLVKYPTWAMHLYMYLIICKYRQTWNFQILPKESFSAIGACAKKHIYVYTCIQAEFLTRYSKLKSRGSAYLRIIEVWSHKDGCYQHVSVIFCPHRARDITFHISRQRFTLLHCSLTEMWKATVDKRMVSKGIWWSPKRCKITMYNFFTNSICEKTWHGIM